MIGPDVRGVAEIYLGTLFLRHLPDFRIILLQPLLNQSLVPFLRTMQRLLAGDAELRQKPPNRHRAQDNTELVLDQLRDHLACPQRKRELQLQRVFLCHRVVNPPQLLAVELRRTSRQGLRLQTIPAATPVSRQPSVDGRPVDTKNTGDDLGTFAILNTLHRAHAHLFQRLMIKLSRVVISHAGTESIPVHAVKQNIELLMNGLIHARSWLPSSGIRLPPGLSPWEMSSP